MSAYRVFFTDLGIDLGYVPRGDSSSVRSICGKIAGKMIGFMRDFKKGSHRFTYRRYADVIGDMQVCVLKCYDDVEYCSKVVFNGSLTDFYRVYDPRNWFGNNESRLYYDTKHLFYV